MMTLTRLVAPPRPTCRLTTVHAPALEIVPIYQFLQARDPRLEIEWLNAEDGEPVHTAVVVPAPGGIVVVNDGAEHRVALMKCQRKNKVTIELECPRCRRTFTQLYLFAAAADGRLVRLGPGCRACAGLVHGPARLLMGQYARRMIVNWLDAHAPASRTDAPDGNPTGVIG